MMAVVCELIGLMSPMGSRPYYAQIDRRKRHNFAAFLESTVSNSLFLIHLF
jgi:hypothetical protein